MRNKQQTAIPLKDEVFRPTYPSWLRSWFGLYLDSGEDHNVGIRGIEKEHASSQGYDSIVTAFHKDYITVPVSEDSSRIYRGDGRVYRFFSYGGYFVHEDTPCKLERVLAVCNPVSPTGSRSPLQMRRYHPTASMGIVRQKKSVYLLPYPRIQVDEQIRGIRG